MSAAAKHNHLQLVDTETGEIIESCPRCAELEDQIAGMERDLRGWRFRYAELRRDKDGEARTSEFWTAAVRVFDAWKLACRHPKSRWDVGRFELILPFLKSYGEEMCLRAVAGIAFDPFVTTRKNGSSRRHDGWDLLFRSRDKFEEMANRAPQDWRPPARVEKSSATSGLLTTTARPNGPSRSDSP